MNVEKIAPWLPAQDFFLQNQETLSDIFNVTKKLYPNSGAREALEIEDGRPTNEATLWMWDKFMGHQHGSIEGYGGKLRLRPDDEPVYRSLIDSLHYGNFSFSGPVKAQSIENISKAFVLGSIPSEFMERIMASVDYKPNESKTQDIICLTGQRLRWNIIGERTTNEIYQQVSLNGKINIEDIVTKSPWAKLQSEKNGKEWEQAFASEYEIGRLCVEAIFRDSFDWSNYPVTIDYDSGANPLYYLDAYKNTKFIPPREELSATYHLKDGRNVRVVNAKAEIRNNSLPRPNADSQTKEALELVPFSNCERILAVSSAPHLRAALDALVRIVHLRSNNIARIDVVTGRWTKEVETLRGLGEIPATQKAHMRLRAVLQGKDPDNIA